MARAFNITFKDEAIQEVDLKAGTWTFHALVNADTYTIGLKDTLGVWHNYDLSDQTGTGWYDVEETIPTTFDTVQISLLNNVGTAQVMYPMFEKGARRSVKRPHELDIEEAAIIKSASWEIHTSSPVIYKDAPDLLTDGVHTPVTVTGRHWVGSTMTEEGFITVTANDDTEALNASPSPVTIAPLNSADKQTYTIRLYNDANKTELLDWETIPVVFKGAKGVNAIRLHINNPIDGLPADSAGNVLTFVGTGTSIHVFEGAVELDYDGIGTANGKFKVAAIPTNITMGAITDSGNICIVADATAMPVGADKASIVYTVTGKTLDGFDFSIVGEQNFTKTKMGAKGDTGVSVVSITPYYAVSTSATVAPTTWSTTVPAKLPTEYMWQYEVITYSDASTQETAKRVVSGINGEDGTDGINGIDGLDGISITSVVSEYAVNTSATTAPTVFSVTMPARNAGQYLWVREKISYSSGSPSYTLARVVTGDKGDAGLNAPLLYLSASAQVMRCNNDNSVQAGQTINIEAKLQNVTGTATFVATPYNDAGAAQTAITLGGTGNIRTLISTQWLATFKRVEITATLGTLTDKVTIHRLADAAAGKGVSGTEIRYQASTSGTVVPTGTWLTTIPAVPADQYLWTRTIITYTDATTSTSYSVGKMGATGSAGKGISGTVIDYQASASGTSVPAGTWTLGIPSVSPSQFLWTRTVITYTDATTSTAYSVGQMGATGVKGDSNVVGFLTNQSITLQASSIGVVSSFATATGEFWVYYGLTRVTSGIAFSKVSNIGCTAAITASGVYSVSAMSADNATAIFRAVYGGVTIDCVLSLSKSKAGTGVTSVRTEYYLSTSSTTQTGGTWQTTVPTWTTGTYIWERLVTVKDNATETVGTPYLSQAWENINQLKADLIEEQAKTQYQTTTTGGLIYTALMKLFDAATGDETAGINGILGVNRDNPSFYSGGSYARALGLVNFLLKMSQGTAPAAGEYDALAKITMLHNGAAKIGDFIIEESGRIVLVDPTTGKPRLVFGISDIPIISELAAGTFQGTSVSNVANLGIPVGTTFLTNTINVTTSGAEVSFSASSLRLVYDLPSGQVHVATIEVGLYRDNQLVEVMGYIERSGAGTGTDEIAIDKVYAGMQTGVYKVGITYFKTTFPGSSFNAQISGSTLGWSWEPAEIRYFQFGVNGMMAFFSDNHWYFTEVDGFDLRGKTNMPGILLSGTVNSGGGWAAVWGAKTSTTSPVNNSTGRYTVYHTAGHSNYQVNAVANTSSKTCHIVSKASTNFVIEWRTVASTPALVNTGFDFQIVGNNYA